MTHEVPFGLLDLSNPKTVAWMESIIAAMALSAGVDPTSGRPRVQACAQPPPPSPLCLAPSPLAAWLNSISDNKRYKALGPTRRSIHAKRY